MTRDLLKAALDMIWRFNADCIQLRIRINTWNMEASKLTSDCNKLNFQVREYHAILENLRYNCKKHIREPGFFLAKTKLYKNMAKHGVEHLGSVVDTSKRIKYEIKRSIV